MSRTLRPAFAASALALCCLTVLAQQSAPPPTIVQPGAPGASNKSLSPTAANAGEALKAPSKPDADFMQGMIMHHSQAVEMTRLLLTRTHNKDLQELGKRISISQTDEMKFMKRWLEDRGEPTSMEQSHMNHMGDMKGMAHMDHNVGTMPSMMMPGMLTPAQMKALEQAIGPSFDHLFLTGMIQHHTGALVMVQDLFNTAGAGQDAVLFDFATDVDNTQRAEIKIMQGMLLKERK